MIIKLKKNEVFVFGSNLNGAHAGGAALQAFQKFGAELGVGEGLTGRCYAFPTLDKNMQKVSGSTFKKSVKKLYKVAGQNPDKVFLLTKVGCGIAGFDESEVRGQFRGAPVNVILPEDWKEKPVRRLYKFLNDGLKSNSGDHTWKVGEWYAERNIRICNRGFHASNTPMQAMGYVKGPILALVEARGESVEEEDKSCWEEMRVVEAYNWTKADSVALSIYAADLCIENYEKLYPTDKRPREAIEAAKKWLADPTSENESAAWSAAWSAESAAWSAARSAESAWSAAWSAARSAESAAWSAARSAESAAESAARSAARSAESAARSDGDKAYHETLKKITTSIDAWMIERIKVLKHVA